MMKKLPGLIRAAMPRPLISPHGFFAAAVVLSLLFGVCHALGWRDYSTILSGNMLPEGKTDLGILYVLAYFGFVIVFPILVLASAIFWLLLRPWRRP